MAQTVSLKQSRPDPACTPPRITRRHLPPCARRTECLFVSSEAPWRRAVFRSAKGRPSPAGRSTFESYVTEIYPTERKASAVEHNSAARIVVMKKTKTSRSGTGHIGRRARSAKRLQPAQRKPVYGR